MNSYKWKRSEDTFLRKNINKYSRKELAFVLNKKDSQVRGYCYIHQIKKSKLGKKIARGSYIRVSKEEQEGWYKKWYKKNRVKILKDQKRRREERKNENRTTI